MKWLRLGTAANIVIGPLVDVTDGVSEETGETAGTLILHKLNTQTTSGSFTMTHLGNGYYSIALTASHTDTLGSLMVSFHNASVYAPHRETFTVIPANVYDALVAGSDKIQTDLTEIAGNSTNAAALGTNIGNLDVAVSACVQGTLADVQAECEDALEAYRLNEFFVTALSGQPVAGTLLGDLTEDDGGTQRMNANALELAPTGGTNPNVLASTTISLVNSQTSFTLSGGSDQDDAYTDMSIVLTDASNSDFPSVRRITGYVGLTKEVSIDSAPGFTILAGDGVKVFVTGTALTASERSEIARAWCNFDGSSVTGASRYALVNGIRSPIGFASFSVSSNVLTVKEGGSGSSTAFTTTLTPDQAAALVTAAT